MDAKEYYLQDWVQHAICEAAKDKEVRVRQGDHDRKGRVTIRHPRDVKGLAEEGATSFHFTAESWDAPERIDKEMSQPQLDTLRKGWDFIIDIDPQENHTFEQTKLITYRIWQFLARSSKYQTMHVKFSGKKGFHIGIGPSSLPLKVDGMCISQHWPEMPKRFVEYIKSEIGPELEKEVPGAMATIDLNMFTRRHTYRAPYSLHEGSGLVSLPFDYLKLRAFYDNPENPILKFEKHMADPANLRGRVLSFLNVGPGYNGDFNDFIQQCYYATQKGTIPKTEYDGDLSLPETAIPHSAFPPCMIKMLEGLKDGRKRGLFVLSCFLWAAGWKQSDVLKQLYDWNKKNERPMPNSQIEYHVGLRYRSPKKLVPYDCSNPIYKDIGVCKMAPTCRQVRNPIAYAKRLNPNK